LPAADDWIAWTLMGLAVALVMSLFVI